MGWFDRLKQRPDSPVPKTRVVIPTPQSEEHRRWEAAGSIDYSTTRGIYVYREDRGIGVVVRIFVSGNRSLQPFGGTRGDHYEDPGYMTREQYVTFRRGLLELMYPPEHLPTGLESSYLRIYENYVALQEPWIEAGVKVPDFMDDEKFLRPVLAVLENVLGWEAMPEIRWTGFSGPPQPDGRPNHWHLGRR